MILLINMKMKHKAIEAKGRKTTIVSVKMSFKLSKQGSKEKRTNKSFRNNANIGPIVKEVLTANTGIQSQKKSTFRTVTITNTENVSTRTTAGKELPARLPTLVMTVSVANAISGDTYRISVQ